MLYLLEWRKKGVNLNVDRNVTLIVYWIFLLKKNVCFWLLTKFLFV